MARMLVALCGLSAIFAVLLIDQRMTTILYLLAKRWPIRSAWSQSPAARAS